MLKIHNETMQPKSYSNINKDIYYSNAHHTTSNIVDRVSPNSLFNQRAIHKKSISMLYNTKQSIYNVKHPIPAIKQIPKNNLLFQIGYPIAHQRMHSDVIYNHIQIEENKRKKSLGAKYETNIKPYKYEKNSLQSKSKNILINIAKYNTNSTYSSYLKRITSKRLGSSIRNYPLSNNKGQSFIEKPTDHFDSFDSKEMHNSSFTSQRQSSINQTDISTALNISSNMKDNSMYLNNAFGIKKLTPNVLINTKPKSNIQVTMPSTITGSPSRKLSCITKYQYAPSPIHFMNKVDRIRKVQKVSNQITQFYQIGKILGTGAFGKVYLGVHKLTNKKVAIKTIKKEFLENKDNMEKLMREVNILKSLYHPSIVQFFEQFETDTYLCLILELCEGGDLLSYVRKRKKLCEEQARFIFRQIVDGVLCCHSNNILHRDIKLDNILFNSKGMIKIADFGVSVKYTPGLVMHEQCGTPAYIAPEVFEKQGYFGYSSDVWSCGIVLYALIYGTVPFKAGNINDLKLKIKESKFKTKPKASNDVNNLLENILMADPSKRFTIGDICNHPWMQNSDLCYYPIFTATENKKIQGDNSMESNAKSTIGHNDAIFEDNYNESDGNNSVKSNILTPYNSFTEDDMPCDVKIDSILSFIPAVRDYDRQYEKNNNCEVDNGVYNKLVCDSSEQSSQAGEEPENNERLNEPIKYTNTFTNNSLNEDIVKTVESFGYRREYIIQSIANNAKNHASACYYILMLL